MQNFNSVLHDSQVADGAHAVSCWIPVRAGDLIVILGTVHTVGTVIAKEHGLWAWQAVMDENKYRGEGWARRESGEEREGYLISAVPVSGEL